MKFGEKGRVTRRLSEGPQTMRRFFALLSFVFVVAFVAVALNPPAALWGCWTVKRALPTTNIAALSQEQANRIVGRRIVYSTSCAKSGRILLKSPIYETTALSEREFFELTHIPLKQLGITEPTTTMVILSGAEDQANEFVGDTVFLGGAKPVIEFEGVYFELEKAKMHKNCACSTQRTTSAPTTPRKPQ